MRTAEIARHERGAAALHDVALVPPLAHHRSSVIGHRSSVIGHRVAARAKRGKPA